MYGHTVLPSLLSTLDSILPLASGAPHPFVGPTEKNYLLSSVHFKSA